ncbi:MAG: citrate/2-methylcitrate synthase, partial [Fimbriiglobus sp.]
MLAVPHAYFPGLEGVIAGESAVCAVEGGLRYRGYAVGELANTAKFDEVAFLLLHGDLPSPRELARFQTRVAAARRLPEPVRQLIRGMPKWTLPVDALRTVVSALSHFDPDVADNSRDANLRKAERLLGQIPVAVADHHRIAKGLVMVPARQDLGHAANFLYMLNGTEPDAAEVRALDVSFTLYAEHEFTASTFAARVIVSTQSDLHAAVTGAIGALKGPLHGGANETVMDVLRAAGGPGTAEAWTLDALSRNEPVTGFGHRIHPTADVRAGILKTVARTTADAGGPDYARWEETADVIEAVMARETGLFPNLDWPAGRLYYGLGLEPPL